MVGITAAMLHPVGLAPFKNAYPDRVYDAGIAEQHAMTMAAGLAMAGLHPVVSIYATFLNRAFDQLLMDVALHKLPVTVTLDRAGVTGPDGASHNGMWDGSILQVVPGLAVAAPRDGSRVAELLNEAIGVSDGPTVVRYPKGTVGAEVEAIGRLGRMDVLAVPGPDLGRDVLLLGAGPMAVTCVEVARRLADHGIGVTVVDPRWLKPLDEAVVEAARQHRLVAVVEDNGRVGGFGDAVARLLRDHDVDVPVKTFGLAQEFLTHGSRDEILEAAGLSPQHLARQLTEAVARRTPEAMSAQAGPQVAPAESGRPGPRRPRRQRVIDAGAPARVALQVCSRLPRDRPPRAPRLKVAVVGSGPAGLYTAEALVKQAALLPSPVDGPRRRARPAPHAVRPGPLRRGTGPQVDQVGRELPAPRP